LRRLQDQSPGIAKPSASGKALPEEFKISFATHPSGSQIVFDDEDWDTAVFWNHNGTQYSRFYKDHVISFLTNALETVAFEDACKQLV